MTDVRTSTIVGQAVMDAIDAGYTVALYVHDVPDAERERLLTQLEERGLRRDDQPHNSGHRGASLHEPRLKLDVNLWGERS